MLFNEIDGYSIYQTQFYVLGANPRTNPILRAYFKLLSFKDEEQPSTKRVQLSLRKIEWLSLFTEQHQIKFTKRYKIDD